MAVIQKINKTIEPLQMAISYYGMISVVNNIPLTRKQIILLAYIATKGSIRSLSAKTEFCRVYDTSVPYIHKMTKDLLRKGFLIKDKNKLKLNPSINLDFTNPVIVQVVFKPK